MISEHDIRDTTWFNISYKVAIRQDDIESSILGVHEGPQQTTQSIRHTLGVLMQQTESTGTICYIDAPIRVHLDAHADNPE